MKRGPYRARLWPYPWDREEFKAALQTHTHEHAAKYQVSTKTIARATKRLGATDLVALLLSRTVADAPPPLVVPPIQDLSPIDVLALFARVAGILGRWLAWVDEPTGGQRLPPTARFKASMALVDKLLRLAESYTAIHTNLMEVLPLKTWLQEMLEVFNQAAPGARAVILEHIRRRIIGLPVDTISVFSGVRLPDSAEGQTEPGASGGGSTPASNGPEAPPSGSPPNPV